MWQNGNYKINSFIKQNHAGFSVKEFKKNNKKDDFILHIIEVSKETYKLNN